MNALYSKYACIYKTIKSPPYDNSIQVVYTKYENVAIASAISPKFYLYKTYGGYKYVLRSVIANNYDLLNSHLYQQFRTFLYSTEIYTLELKLELLLLLRDQTVFEVLPFCFHNKRKLTKNSKGITTPLGLSLKYKTCSTFITFPILDIPYYQHHGYTKICWKGLI